LIPVLIKISCAELVWLNAKRRMQVKKKVLMVF
jgi:hypothetical protein